MRERQIPVANNRLKCRRRAQVLPWKRIIQVIAWQRINRTDPWGEISQIAL
ncbi:MAG: hypothetical protein LUO92_02980 [Methanothrix sp.]|nr:hypothetical protein [Methanothrix sp.]